MACSSYPLPIHSCVRSSMRSFDLEARRAVEIDLAGARIKLLPLERIIASKKAAARSVRAPAPSRAAGADPVEPLRRSWMSPC